MTRYTIVPADALPVAELHAAVIEAFADYVAGPFVIAPEQFPTFLARQAIELALSRAALDAAGAIAAFAFVAPRPSAGRWRLATMGARPAARGQGAAPQLLDELIARQPRLELEVFAQNPRAQRLYESRGFVVRHALHGGELAPAPQPPGVPPVPVPLAQAWAWLDAAEAAQPELPLQVTRAALAGHPAPLQAWRLGDAQLVFGHPNEAVVVVHSLVDLDPAQADAEALVRALAREHPGRTLRCPPLQRDDVGGLALRRAGFAPLPLHQWWMLRAWP